MGLVHKMRGDGGFVVGVAQDGGGHMGRPHSILLLELPRPRCPVHMLGPHARVTAPGHGFRGYWR